MNDDILWAAARLVISLPIVAVLAYLAIKYGLAKRSFLTGGQRRMRLVEQLPIGPRALLSMVETGGKYYLIAHDEKGISLLKEFDEIPEALPVAENTATNSSGNDNILTRILCGMNGFSQKRSGKGAGHGYTGDEK